MNKLIQRIEREVGIEGLASILAERLNPSDLQSLMLEVYNQRASQLQPAQLLSAYENNRFVQPAAVPPSNMLEWERFAFLNLPMEFEPLLISPVCPLGTSSAIALVDQDWAVSTSRNTEVVSDATNVLALECALRRRELLKQNSKSNQNIHLATSHRLLRTVKFEGPNSFSHFGLFGLCSSGRDRGNLQFEFETLRLHIQFYLNTLIAFSDKKLLLNLRITDFNEHDRHPLLEDQLLQPIRTSLPNVNCEFNDERETGRGYYRDLCFHIDFITETGERLNIADGGAVDWTQKLLSNGKERSIISGIGNDRVCLNLIG